MDPAEVFEVTYLQAPEFTPENYSTTVTKIQAFRKGGIRLEHEEIKGKHIFHNYGHGTSGVSFAYGSVYMSTKSLYTYLSGDKPINCAVIGCGLIAMLTAIELNKLGHSVTIYANKFPKIGEKNIDNKSPNQINEGLCLPFGYETFDRFRYELLAKISYDYYMQCLKTNRYQSFKCVTVYERDATIQELKEKIPPFLYNGYQKENVSFGNGVNEKYTKLKTFQINSELFMEELNIEAALRGINLIERHFENGEEVLALEETCIFNNVGFASKNLFNDESMVGTVDHLVIFKNNKKLDYSLSAQIHQNLNIRVHCFEDKIILRNETLFVGEYYEENEEVVKNLIMEAQAFFGNKTMKAKL